MEFLKFGQNFFIFIHIAHVYQENLSTISTLSQIYGNGCLPVFIPPYVFQEQENRRSFDIDTMMSPYIK